MRPQHAISSTNSNAPTSGAFRFEAVPASTNSRRHQGKQQGHALLVRARTWTGAAALGVALMLPSHHSTPAAAAQFPAITYQTSATGTLQQENPAGPAPDQDTSYGPAVAGAGIGAIVAVVLGLAGVRRKKRQRRNDLMNQDLDQTIKILTKVGVEARRLARATGTASTQDLARLDDLVPVVAQAITQHTGNLRDELTHVRDLMTACVAHPAGPTTGLASFATIYRQASTADELVRATTDTTTTARRLRT
ncbi:hypothetical protein OHT59_47055 [Streptomyces sp. NBC_00243]|uniref:hypothetical protein n=1 Tax=Streptomyces sp. NBC_00243 TaxID=2975688 RepID=UPI002DDA9740|nr:hypothetical protein [Streptomyces sp. NBC_00243]WRZ25546.1 hypothetical protein OHT59_47055 [Streptomyces sp. NBC_00243]